MEEIMIKDLFTKHEHRVLAGITKEQAVQAAAWYWRSRQFGINFTSAYALSGVQFYSKIGLRQQLTVMCFDMGQGVGVDATFSAELTDEGAVVGVVGAVLVLPVAVAVGAVSYLEYENDANRLLSDFWSYMSSYHSEPGPPPSSDFKPSWSQSAPEPSPAAPSTAQARSCPSCKASSEPGSRFCRHCGARL